MQKKFIIIDHSLRNLAGHHYEYDVSVAEAASSLGYEPVIICNKKFPKPLYPKNIKVIPAFTRDWTGVSPLEEGILKKIINVVKSLKLTKFNFKKSIRLFLKVIYEYLFVTTPYLRTILSKAEVSIFRLKDALKSDFAKLVFPIYFIRQTLLVIKKIFVRILPIKTFGWLIKVAIGLSKEIVRIFLALNKKVLIASIGSKKLVFASELKTVFKTININSEDHIFIHTIGIDQLEELLIFLSSTTNNSPHYHILLRRDCNEPLVTCARGIGLRACLNRFYGAGLFPKLVTFYTDTDELTKQHNALSPIRFITAPIPFRHENLKECFPSVDSQISEPINIVYLGDARPEKGYQYLPQLVDVLWFSYIQPGKVKFTIQSNFNLPGGEPGMQEARLRLEQYPSNKVCLLKEPLSTEDYYEVLAGADIVVIPYLPESYAVRSSGVLVESLAAGKPIVVPSGSWMANQVDESRATIYESPSELYDAVMRILRNFQKFTQAASDYRTVWRAKHSPSSLVKCLIEKEEYLLDHYLNKPAPSIVYIIDGDSILQRVGAGQVARNHLDYLSRCGYRVYGVFFFHDPKILDEDFANRVSLAKKALEDFNLIETWFLRYKFPVVSQVNQNINYILSHAEKKPDLELELVARSYVDIPKSLKSFLQSQKLDAVLLNYIPSWSIVQKLGLDKYPVICEMHDIQSQQYAFYNNREINQKEFLLECSLLDQCNVVLANNLKELEKVQEVVRKSALHQVPYIGRLLPPKISDLAGYVDLSEVLLAGGSANSQAIEDNSYLKQQRSIDILYVSSYHYPNIYSLKWFFHQVYMPYLADKGVTFVIAGNIMSCGDLNEISHQNIFVAGSLESLKPIYAATRVVILPIKMGAGFNIKAIEAVSMGKPVVATSMALRGLEFDPEKFKCFDEPEAFAARILELLESDETRLEQATQGYELIQGRYNQAQYDKAMNAAFADALGERSLTPPQTEAIHWQPQLVEWSPGIQAFNKILRQFISQQEVELEDWELVKAHWELQGSTVFQKLYRSLIEKYTDSIDQDFVEGDVTDLFKKLEMNLGSINKIYREFDEVNREFDEVNREFDSLLPEKTNQKVIPMAQHVLVPIDHPKVVQPNAAQHIYVKIQEIIDNNITRITNTISKLSSWFDKEGLQSISDEKINDISPYWNNGYFSDDDARIAYAIVCEYKPNFILEIGSGNSTKFFRKAITDTGIRSTIISIDPEPRAEINSIADTIIKTSVLEVDKSIFLKLDRNDVLFLDGSHLVFNGTDTTYFFLEILPLIKPGVLVHIHDIMLPYDYDNEFTNRGYNEQYMLATLLLNNEKWKPILPICYLHRKGLLNKGGVSFWMINESI